MTTEPIAETAREATKVGADVVRAVGQVVAVLAAGVGVIYVLGGLVVWLRLRLVGVPQLAIVAELPREVLVSAGLVVVGLALVVGALYALTRHLLRPGDEIPPSDRGGLGSTFKHAGWWRVVRFGIVLALPALVIVVSAWKWNQKWVGTAGIGHWYGSVAMPLIVLVFGCVWALLAIHAWGRFGGTYWDRAERTAQAEHAELCAANAEAEAANQKADEARKNAEDARGVADNAHNDARTASEAARNADASLREGEREYAMSESERATSLEQRALAAEQRALDAEGQAQQAKERAEKLSFAADLNARTQKLATESFNKPAAIAVSALFWAAVWVPSFFVAEVSVPLTEAKACGSSADSTNPALDVEGEFIGETGQRAFLADAGDRIVSLSLDDYGRVYIGDAASSSC